MGVLVAEGGCFFEEIDQTTHCRQPGRCKTGVVYGPEFLLKIGRETILIRTAKAAVVMLILSTNRIEFKMTIKGLLDSFSSSFLSLTLPTH